MPLAVGAFRGEIDWEALAARAVEGDVALSVLLPSHVPEIFEAATGAYGRFAEVERGVREAVRRGARVVIQHPITRASLVHLPDLARYVDEALGEVAGVSFWIAPSPDAPSAQELAPWWRAAMHGCMSRGVGVEAGDGLVVPDGVPTLLVDQERHMDRRGLSREGDERRDATWMAVLRRPGALDAGADLARALSAALGLRDAADLALTVGAFKIEAPKLAPDLAARWRAQQLDAMFAAATRGREGALEVDVAALVTVRLPDPSPDGSLDAPSLATVEALVRALSRPDGGCLASVGVNLLDSHATHRRYLAALRARCEPLGAVVRVYRRDARGAPADAARPYLAARCVWALSTSRPGDLDAPLAAGLNLLPDALRGEVMARLGALADASYGPARAVWCERVQRLLDAVCVDRESGAGLAICDDRGDQFPCSASAWWWGATEHLASGVLAFCQSAAALSALGHDLAGEGPSGLFGQLFAGRAPDTRLEDLRLYGIAVTTPHRPVSLAVVGATGAPVVVDLERCDGSARCAMVCPTGALTLVASGDDWRLRPSIDAARCSACHACVEQCPQLAVAPAPTSPSPDEPDDAAALAWSGAALRRRGSGWIRALTPGAVAPEATLPPTWQRPRRFGERLLVLGVAAATHLHHGACLLRDGEVVGAVQEERFRRRKQYGWNLPGSAHATIMSDPRIPVDLPFPWASIAWLLERAGIALDDVDVVAVNGIPARLRNTYSPTDAGRPPRPYRSGRMVFIPHHLAHAASAYAVSGLDGAPVFTVDGRGERETAAFFEPGPDGLTRTWDLLATEDASIGGVFESLTMLLGFGAGGAGSTMGLAPYGRPTMDFSRVLSARDHRDVTVHFREAQRLGDPLRRARDAPITQAHKDLAASLQQALERTVITLLRSLLRGRSVDALCMAGGVALNCSMNARIRAELGLRELFVQPAAHDGGTALGAAMEAHRMITGAYPMTPMTHAYLGPDYADHEVERALRDFGVPYQRSDDPARDAAERIADGQVVCWHQGRMEYGPRALGARSILADPRSRTARDRINLMKGRAWWRPLGPSVLAGTESDWFEGASHSPFMLLSQRVLRERRDEVPAVVHVDGTTRPQSVTARDNPRFHRLLELFAAKTGVPMVINTSFNTAWEPIVCSPHDALASFLQLGADHLFVGDFIVERHALERRARRA
jgi:carbamoyltransferase